MEPFGGLAHDPWSAEIEIGDSVPYDLSSFFFSRFSDTLPLSGLLSVLNAWRLSAVVTGLPGRVMTGSPPRIASVRHSWFRILVFPLSLRGNRPSLVPVFGSGGEPTLSPWFSRPGATRYGTRVPFRLSPSQPGLAPACRHAESGSSFLSFSFRKVGLGRLHILLRVISPRSKGAWEGKTTFSSTISSHFQGFRR